MSKSISEIDRNVSLTLDIINQMQMQRDEQITLQMAEVEIELDGLRVNHSGVSQEVALQLIKLHSQNISLKLQEVVRSCLGYYALAEQPLGTNEPPIGPIFAQQLLARLDETDIDIMALKDEIHGHLTNREETSGNHS